MSEWSEAEGKQVPRKYYRITDEGQNALIQIQNVWQNISAGVEKIMEDKKNES